MDKQIPIEIGTMFKCIKSVEPYVLDGDLLVIFRVNEYSLLKGEYFYHVKLLDGVTKVYDHNLIKHYCVEVK